MSTWLLTALLPMMSAEGTLPPPPPSPLLFVRFIGPEGSTVTVRPGGADARTYPAPAIAGFRPGYGYRLQLSQLPGMPAGASLFPTMEVLDTLHIPPGLKAEDFPATVQFTIDDMRRASAGGLVTKVVYLEDPFQAPAVQSTPDKPVEFDVYPGKDPLEEARVRGRPIAIVRLGERELAPQELAAVYIAGTVLALGDAGFGPPAAPPTLPKPNFQWFDPRTGPRKPLEEILPDGGDVGLRIGIGPDGKMGNLDITDTAAEYRYGLQPKRVTISNRVCLFSPRFAVLRAELQPLAQDLIVAPMRTELTIGQSELRNREVTDLAINVDAPRGFHGKIGVRGTQSRIGVAVLDKTVGVSVTGSIDGVMITTGLVEPITALQTSCCCRPTEPLCLTKYAEPKAPKVGEIVTFVIRYENVGTKPIRDVVIADSLASRFDYIAGSAQADRPAAFTIQPNSVWSALLRWQVNGDLLPGQSGAVRFQARVR